MRLVLVAPGPTPVNDGMADDALQRSRTDDWPQTMAAIAADRDRGAFSRLFLHFGPRVKGYLRRQGLSEPDAEEVMQDVMLTVWRRAGQYDPAKASPSTWIFTIARNRRIDALRRARPEPLDTDDPSLLPGADIPHADDRIDMARKAARLASAFEQLTADQADLLRRAYFDHKSHSKIAAELSIPLGTVKSRLRLAIRRLRSVMGEHA